MKGIRKRVACWPAWSFGCAKSNGSNEGGSLEAKEGEGFGFCIPCDDDEDHLEEDERDGVLERRVAVEDGVSSRHLGRDGGGSRPWVGSMG